MSNKPVALQLWTVREEMAKDVRGTFARIAEIGYEGVELWFPEYPPALELRELAAEVGLRIISAHVPFLQLRDDLDAVVAYHKELGNLILTIPVLPKELRATAEDWKARVEEIGIIGRRCRDLGFTLAYHNHGFEFEDMVDGMAAHDYLFENVPADLLMAELDTSFVFKAGRNPAEMIRRYAGRGPLLHLKEVHKQPDRFQNAEIGHGQIDWGAVFRAADESGVEWYVVEQNCQERPALESIRMSYEFLAGAGGGVGS